MTVGSRPLPTLFSAKAANDSAVPRSTGAGDDSADAGSAVLTMITMAEVVPTASAPASQARSLPLRAE
jgi:hypothetical protein